MADETQDQQQQPADTHKREGDATQGEPSREIPKDKDVKTSVQLSPEKDAKAGDKNLAVFDFDGTLTKHDSLKQLMIDVAGGRLKAYAALILSCITSFIEGVMTTDDYMDYKSAIKAGWIGYLLRGRTIEDIQDRMRKLKEHMEWHDGVIADLKKYAEQGMDIVVATGALDIYIDILLEGLPVKTVICAGAEVGEDGKLTGCLKGQKVHANPVRHEKRIRLQDYIKQNGPYARVVGYGNMPDDGPMLSLCDEFFVV